MRDHELTADLEKFIGRVVRGKWRIDELLGSGSMSHVFAATHRNGSRVAIKLLRTELARHPEICARFLREGYLANAVGHGDAVRVLDDDVEGDHVFLVMELLEGESCERRARAMGGRLRVQQVLYVADRTLDVLAAAHARSIVHRDIKPSNLFITKTSSVRVLDFGIASVNPSARDKVGRFDGVGTPGFMPPEQAQGRLSDVDVRSDVFALGATMYKLLSGQYAEAGPACALSRVAAHVPREVARVIEQALAFEKADRWADARAMQAALRAATSNVRAASEGSITTERVTSPDLRVSASDELDPRSLLPTPTPAKKEKPSLRSLFVRPKTPRADLFGADPSVAEIEVSEIEEVHEGDGLSGTPTRVLARTTDESVRPVAATIDPGERAFRKRRRWVAAGAFTAGAALLGPVFAVVIGLQSLAHSGPESTAAPGESTPIVVTRPGSVALPVTATETPSPQPTDAPPPPATAVAIAARTPVTPPPEPQKTAAPPTPTPRYARPYVAPAVAAPPPSPARAGGSSGGASWLDRRN